MMAENRSPDRGEEAPPGTPGTGEDICPACRGTGRLDGDECVICAGTGVVVERVA
jgi:DnaJ-class molecular chaperone